MLYLYIQMLYRRVERLRLRVLLRTVGSILNVVWPFGRRVRGEGGVSPCLLRWQATILLRS